MEENDAIVPFKSMTSADPRQLTQEDIEKLEKQTVVSDFKQRKLEIEAQKNWDRFYHRNSDKFFKDRNWSAQDLEELCADIDLNASIIYLEAGCGVGNMLFPLASSFPLLKLQAFDFSKNAVRLLEERAAELHIPVETNVLDLSKLFKVEPFSALADIATLIFVMSAIHPEKLNIVIQNMKSLVKIGGSVIVRDYAINDYAMIRFGRDSKISERFYVRQDGTRAYYFELEELVKYFEDEGFVCKRKEYLYRKTVNHQKGLNVPRSFVQARFVREI